MKIAFLFSLTVHQSQTSKYKFHFPFFMVVRSITTLEYLNHANSDSFARLRRKRQILKLHFPNCNSNLKLKSLVNDLQIGDYRTGQKHVFLIAF